MKKVTQLFTIVLFVVFILNTTKLLSQVAINTTGLNAVSSAMLDVSSIDKGILIPRVILNDVNTDAPVADPETGLLIYNQGGTEEEGFYYWAGTKWLLLVNSTSVVQTDEIFDANQLAELYENNDFSSPTEIELQNTTMWYGWISATEGKLFGSMTTDTVNTTGDQIVIGEDGLYNVEMSSSFGGGTNNFQLTATVWHTPSGGSATETRIEFLTKIGSNGDIGSGTTFGLMDLSAGDVLDIRFNSKKKDAKLEIYTLNFIVSKVGE